jgi:hypothetical protein
MEHLSKAERAIKDSESLEPFQEIFYHIKDKIDLDAFYIGLQRIQKRLKLTNILLTKRRNTVILTKLDDSVLLPSKIKYKRRSTNGYYL